MLELPNSGYMTTCDRRNRILLVTSWIKIMTLQLLFQNSLISRRPRVANFADIIKTAIMFIKTTFKQSKKLNELEIMY